MTAGALAERLEARRTGPGRWQSRCPAHQDRLPSLSIREAEDGRTLLLCRAGCRTEDVLRAAGLHWRDLYAGPAPSPAETARLRQERDARAEAERRARQRERCWRDSAEETAETLRRGIRELSGRLIAMPDGPEAESMTATLHRMCDVLHGYEMLAEMPFEGFGGSARSKSRNFSVLRG